MAPRNCESLICTCNVLQAYQDSCFDHEMHTSLMICYNMYNTYLRCFNIAWHLSLL
jgi:hypothetical protein